MSTAGSVTPAGITGPAPAKGGPALPGELPGAIAAGVLLLVSLVLQWFVPGERATEAARVLAWASLGIGLVYGGAAAIKALLARSVDIDVLMVVAAVLAAWLGHPAEGALLMFLFVLAGALEDRAMRRAMRAVEALHKLMPTAAQAWRDGQWASVAPDQLAVGDRVLIRTGELIPADAQVLEGQSTIDQATLTGESVPRVVGPGDELYAGTLNVGHPIEATVRKPARESSLQKVLDLVISAQQQREPLQRLIDRLSQPYAIGVMVGSLAVGLVWWGLLGVEPADAAKTAITLLIVASPCALIIATPTATLAAISRAARGGLLFKGGQSIERLAHLSAVALDKTGTLTLGKPRLQQVHAVGWSDGRTLLEVAAALEARSTHPIAVAVVDAARARGLSVPEATDLLDLPGKGLSGRVTTAQGRAEARLGTMDFCQELIPVCLRARTSEVLERIRARGQIGVVVAIAATAPTGGEPAEEERSGQVAVLVLSDTIRPGAAEMVASLNALGVSPIRMLTGDHASTAAHVAQRVGVDRFDASLLPADKVRLLEDMKAQIRSAHARGPSGVGVIGDGVNDAPALAAADVSIAIGSIGSDAALESADIVLLNDDLRVIPWGLRLARRTRSIVKFNIAFALGVIAFMGTLTLVSSLSGDWRVPLPLAVLAHEGGTLLVVANSLRLLLMGGPGASTPDAPNHEVFHSDPAVSAPAAAA